MNTNTRNLWKVIFSPIIIGKLVACEMLLTVFLPLEKFDRICRPSWEKVTSLTNSLESLPASWLPNTGQPGPIKNVSRSGRHRDRAKCQFDGHKSGDCRCFPVRIAIWCYSPIFGQIPIIPNQIWDVLTCINFPSNSHGYGLLEHKASQPMTLAEFRHWISADESRRHHGNLGLKIGYPLVMTNIAIENGPFIVDLPIKNSDFP